MISQAGAIDFAVAATPLIESAAADGDHERVDAGRVLEDLERDGRRAGDNLRVVVRRDELGPGVGRERLRHPLRIVVVAAVGAQHGAVMADGVELGLRRIRRREHREQGG